MTIFEKLKDYLYSDDDSWNILKMYMFLPFSFTFFWFYGFGNFLIINYIYVGMVITFAFSLIFAIIYHRKQLYWDLKYGVKYGII